MALRNIFNLNIFINSRLISYHRSGRYNAVLITPVADCAGLSNSIGHQFIRFKSISAANDNEDLTTSPHQFNKSEVIGAAQVSDISTIIDLESHLFENSSNSHMVDESVNFRETQTRLNRKNKWKHYERNNVTVRRTATSKKEHDFDFNKINKLTRQKVPPKSKESEVQIEVASPQLIFDEKLELTYTRLDRRDSKIQQLMLSIKSRSKRSHQQEIILEGRRLILEAINAEIPIKYLLFNDIECIYPIADDLKRSLLKTTSIFQVPHADLRYWSDLTTSPGLIAIFQKPYNLTELIRKQKKQQSTHSITVICDQIREPNNLGSIIRNCAAIPVGNIVLIKGCADPWEPKSLRGGAGAHFHVPITGPVPWEAVDEILKHLNFNINDGKKDLSVYLAENSPSRINRVNDNMGLKYYSDCNFSIDNHSVIIIGGETHGLSDEAYKLMRDKNGECLHIPLANGMDSLNTSAALAIILFEIRRQIKNSNGPN